MATDTAGSDTFSTEYNPAHCTGCQIRARLDQLLVPASEEDADAICDVFLASLSQWEYAEFVRAALHGNAHRLDS